MGSPNTLLNSLKRTDYTDGTPAGPPNIGKTTSAVNGAKLYPDRQFSVFRLVSAGAETRTVPNPTKSGLQFALNRVTIAGTIAITFSRAFNEAGDTVINCTAAGQIATFESVEDGAGTYVWRLISNDGMTGVTTAVPGAITVTGALTGASSIKSTSATGGVGYGTGAGGAVTQITSSSTGVTLNKITGQITTVALTTAAAAEERFTVTNSTVAATDTITLGTTYNGAGTPALSVLNVTAGAFDVIITNLHAANALNALMVINFAVIKAVAA